MSHTPGPWHYHSSGLVTTNSDSRLGESIALVGDTGIQVFHNHNPVSIPEANARLIASAPDLLEALQELLAVSPYDSTLPEVRPAVDKSIAALRKAIG